MAWQTPITDWDGVSPNRKYYNFTDLNRVESNTYELALLISSYQTAPTLESQVTNRTNSSIDYADCFNRVERNINAIKNATYQPVGWTSPRLDYATGQKFDYNDANRLESNLFALYTMINNTKDYFKFCGALNTGEDNTYL